MENQNSKNPEIFEFSENFQDFFKEVKKKMVLRQHFQNPVYRTLEDTIDSNFTDLHHQRAPERDANLTRVTQLELVQNDGQLVQNQWKPIVNPM